MKLPQNISCNVVVEYENTLMSQGLIRITLTLCYIPLSSAVFYQVPVFYCDHHHCSSFCYCFVCGVSRFYLFIFIEKRRKGEGEVETDPCARDTLINKHNTKYNKLNKK